MNELNPFNPWVAALEISLLLLLGIILGYLIAYLTFYKSRKRLKNTIELVRKELEYCERHWAENTRQ